MGTAIVTGTGTGGTATARRRAASGWTTGAIIPLEGGQGFDIA
jgi:hypothetical protein